jgi:hypothetical protein
MSYLDNYKNCIKELEQTRLKALENIGIFEGNEKKETFYSKLTFLSNSQIKERRWCYNGNKQNHD